MAKEFFILMQEAQPNAAHRALVELEREGILDRVLTQNVDALHQRAGHGPDRVLEVHGTATRIRCIDCNARVPARPLYEALVEGEVPYCDQCRGILKPDVVLFGESIAPEVAAQAIALVARCDLFLVIGSSLTVQPFASLAARAKNRGAALGIVNLSSTPYDGDMDVVVRGSACEVLPWVVSRLNEERALA
jgi:NAD-dependent deacetylase